MNKEMFDFLKKYDDNLYKVVKYEVEPNLGTNVCVEKILDCFHVLFKKVKIEETDIVIRNDFGFEENNPSLSCLLNNDEFKNFLFIDLKITNSDMALLKQLNVDANKKKHGKRIYDSTKKEYSETYIDFSIDDKKDYFKLLYDICLKIYNYHFGESIQNEWDIMYFNYHRSKILVSTNTTEVKKSNKLVCSCCGREITVYDRFCNYCAQNNEYYKG